MVVPMTIGEQSPLDPSLILPVPSKLPNDPSSTLKTLSAAIEAQLDPSLPSSSKLSIPVITAQMRQVTRNSQILVNAARVGAAEARSELDRVDVGLRGVEYERVRVRDEISRCADYAPDYEKLELSDSAAFLESLDEEQRSKLPTSEEEGYEHALTIARLETELADIIQREEELAALLKEQEGVIRTKKEIKNKFDAVDTYLADYAKTTGLVQQKIKNVGGSSSTPN